MGRIERMVAAFNQFKCAGNLIVRPAGQGISRLFLVLTLSSIAFLATDEWRDLRAEPLKARIVGLGATTCQRFNDDVRSNPSVRRDYLAWAQGFMSGVLLSRPPGIDEGLDLAPATFDLIGQLHFLEDHCSQNAAADFADASKRSTSGFVRRARCDWNAAVHRFGASDSQPIGKRVRTAFNERWKLCPAMRASK